MTIAQQPYQVMMISLVVTTRVSGAGDYACNSLVQQAEPSLTGPGLVGVVS